MTEVERSWGGMVIDIAGWTRRTWRVVIAGLMVGMVGCVPPSDEGTVQLSDLPHLSLVEEARIGSVEDPDYGFSSVDEVDVDEDGNLYVFERQDREIRVYSPEGELLHRIGGPGQGPGEFQGPRFSFGVKGDTVWVIDPFANRVTLFDRRGELISTGSIERPRVVLDEAGASSSLVPFEMGADGFFASELGTLPARIAAAAGASVVSGSASSGGIEFDPVRYPRVRFDATGAVRDTVGWGVYPAWSGPSHLFSWATPSGRIVAEDASGEHGAAFRVTRLDLAGEAIHVRNFEYEPVASDTTDQTLRPVTRILVGKDESLWVRREDKGTESVDWLVLDSVLEPVGVVSLPGSSFRVEWIRNGAIWVVESDDLGVQWLVRYRVVEG